MRTETVSRLQIATVTGLSLVCAYALAFYWQLDRPFWAGFTVFMLSLPSLGQSLQKGSLRIVGTFIGATLGLVLFMLVPQQRFLLLFLLSFYLSGMMYCMSGSRFYGYFFFITSIVTMLIVLVGSEKPAALFDLAVYRSEETLLGIAVYTLITLLVAPQLSVRTFTGNMEKLLQAHLELFVQTQEQEKEGALRDMYEKYTEIRTLVDATELLLPAVKLENSQVYTDRALWRSAIACSAELFETQRKWTGTLLAMKDLNLETLFPDFASSSALLGQLYSRLAGGTQAETGATPLPPTVASTVPTTVASTVATPVPPTVPSPDSTRLPGLHCGAGTLSATERGLVSAAQMLYQRQLRLGLRLHELVAYLLRGGPVPPPDSTDDTTPEPTAFKPQQRTSLVQAFVLFWITACIWIVFDPPGIETMTFMELTLVLGLFILLTGSDPVYSVRCFSYGIVLTGLLYIFVYPLVTSFLLFLALLFAVAFILAFWFSHPAQKALKFGFMMPWLSIGNFTNTPSYSFTAFLSRALILLLGMALVACIHVVLFSKETNTVFIQTQIAFFRTAQHLLERMRNAQGRKPNLFHRLLFWFTLHRLHVLAAQSGLLAKKVARPFMAPALARILGTEIADIATSLQRLQHDLASADRVLSAPVVFAAVAAPKTRCTSSDGIVIQAERVRQMIDSLLADLTTGSRASVPRPDSPNQRGNLRQLEASCGSILRSLSCYVDIVRSLPGHTVP